MEIYYENSAGVKTYLDRNPYKMLSVTSLFDYEWQEDCSSRSSLLTKSTSAKEVNVIVSGASKAEYYSNLVRLLENIDADVVNMTPGRLYIGQYYIDCYFAKSAKGEKYINVRQSKLALSLIPKSDGWKKESTVRFRYQEQQIDSSGRGYPYGYNYDYHAGTGYDSSMENDGFADMDFILTLYGYASNPEIDIGGNAYHLNYTIQKNEYVIVNSAKRTITLIKENGAVVNLFRYRDSSRIFDKIPAGEVSVYWNGSFDFDIMLLEERSEPLWM